MKILKGQTRPEPIMPADDWKQTETVYSYYSVESYSKKYKEQKHDSWVQLSSFRSYVDAKHFYSIHCNKLKLRIRFIEIKQISYERNRIIESNFEVPE